MDEQHRKRLLELIRNPPPGSKLEAARDYGIDLSLFLRSLEMTPAERLRELGAAQPFLRALWGAAKRRGSPALKGSGEADSGTSGK